MILWSLFRVNHFATSIAKRQVKFGKENTSSHLQKDRKMPSNSSKCWEKIIGTAGAGRAGGPCPPQAESVIKVCELTRKRDIILSSSEGCFPSFLS